MYSDTGDTTSLVPGFPIRTSSDPRSVDSSPRHIAASHVLHRLSMPRHPPCALKHLQTQKPRSKNQNCTKQTRRQSSAFASMLATTIQLPNTTPHHQDGATTPQQRVLSQDPTVCRQSCLSRTRRMLLCTRPPPTTGAGPSLESPDARQIPRSAGPAQVSWCSLERR
jgi:hypothetical protein